MLGMDNSKSVRILNFNFLQAIKIPNVEIIYEDSDIYYDFGCFYVSPDNKLKNYEIAHDYFILSAKNNNAKSMYNLGVIYMKGYGVERDFLTALGWFKMAARYKHARSLYNIGCFYLYELGTSYDFERAIKYFKLAAKQGFEKANYVLENCDIIKSRGF